MLKKQRTRRKGLVKVTFSLPRPEAASVHVLGDFNEWRPVHAMRRADDSEWQLAVDLERGHEYRFKYLVDESLWVNDPEADKSVPNPYGSEDSVVVT